jgi:beta-xylosidase
MSVVLSTKGLHRGDCAGLIALQSHYGLVGIEVDLEGKPYIVRKNGTPSQANHEEARIQLSQETLYLKICFDFTDSIDLAEFYYSYDNMEWIIIGTPLKMKYTLDHFMGYRIGLYCYATKAAGGYADFKDFRYSDEIID